MTKQDTGALWFCPNIFKVYKTKPSRRVAPVSRTSYEWHLEVWDADGFDCDHDHEEGQPDRLLERYFEALEEGLGPVFGVYRHTDTDSDQYDCDEHLRFGSDCPAQKTKQRELDSALRRLGR